MSRAYALIVWVHVLSALIWLGGMIFFALTAPVLRTVRDDAVRAALFDALGRRFRTVGWICIAALLVTGVAQLQIRGWWGWDVWGDAAFWRTPLGAALAWKLGLVMFMLGVQAAHDFRVGPAAGRATPGTGEARRLRRRAAWLARINALAGLALVYVAVRLARGG